MAEGECVSEWAGLTNKFFPDCDGCKSCRVFCAEKIPLVEAMDPTPCCCDKTSGAVITGECTGPEAVNHADTEGAPCKEFCSQQRTKPCCCNPNESGAFRVSPMFPAKGVCIDNMKYKFFPDCQGCRSCLAFCEKQVAPYQRQLILSIQVPRRPIPERVAEAMEMSGFKPSEINPVSIVKFAKANGSKTFEGTINGALFPSAGASSFMLLQKWIEGGKDFALSPVVYLNGDNMLANVRTEIAKLNEVVGKTRIYFVGHSSNVESLLAGNAVISDPKYHLPDKASKMGADNIVQLLKDAGLRTKTPPTTVSFMACYAAKLLCPELAPKLHAADLHVMLKCRNEMVGRYIGGEPKKVVSVGGMRIHKLTGSKEEWNTALPGSASLKPYLL